MVTKRENAKRQLRYANARKRVEVHDEGFQPTLYKCPEGMESFRFKKAGKYLIDVIPYVIQSVGSNPFAREDDGSPSPEGTLHWERTVWAHRKLGPDQKDFLCLRKCFNEPCPVCEHVASLLQKPESDYKTVRKEYGEKERQLFLFMDQTSKESREKGIQPYECSHYMGFGELLDTKIKAADAYENFFHLDGGMTLQILVEENSFEGRKFLEPVNIEMFPRKQSLPESLLDDVPDLDEMVENAKVSYKDLKGILYQKPSEGEDAEANGKPAARSALRKASEENQEEDNGEPEEETPAPKKTGKKATPPKDKAPEPPVKAPPKKAGKKTAPTAKDLGIEKDSTVTHAEYGECVVVHASGDGTTVRLQTEDGEVKFAVPVGDVELVEEQGDGEEEPEEEDREETEAEEEGEGVEEEDEEPEDPEPPRRGKRR